MTFPLSAAVVLLYACEIPACFATLSSAGIALLSFITYFRSCASWYSAFKWQVLPKYGFPVGQAGVVQMLAAASRFNDDEDFCTNRAVLNVAWPKRKEVSLIFPFFAVYSALRLVIIMTITEELIGMAPPIDEELEQMERKARGQ